MAAETEELTGQALKDRAAELDIEGRSEMKADELRKAVAEAETADSEEADEDVAPEDEEDELVDDDENEDDEDSDRTATAVAAQLDQERQG
jgi:hypothetical protein